jgi:hypothetical protein
MPPADGHENNDPPHFPNVPTIFNRLELAGIDSWKIYFHDIAQAHTLLQLFLLGSHFSLIGSSRPTARLDSCRPILSLNRNTLPISGTRKTINTRHRWSRSASS